MNYVVFDLEWNQSNTGEEKEIALIPFEIIEFGAVKLNSEKRMIDEFSELVKPQVYHEMHHITRKLIHLQMEQLEQGSPFTEVMKKFSEWCGQDYLFCTWGPLDLIELQRNIRYYAMEPLADGPFPYLDVQKLFSIMYEDGKSRRTLEYAIDYLKIDKDIPFHRAFSDAYYTAKVLCTIDDKTMKRVSYDVFHIPKNKESEIHVVFDTYEKYISRGFADKTAALSDRTVNRSRCYLCNKNIKKKIRWFTGNGKHYYSVAGCDKHGLLKSKIRVKKNEEDRVYIVKTARFITQEEFDDIKERQKKAKKSKV